MSRSSLLLLALAAFVLLACGELPTDGTSVLLPDHPSAAKGGEKGKPDGKGGGSDGGDDGGTTDTFQVLDIQVTVLAPDETDPGASNDPDVQAAVDAYETTAGLAGDFFGCPDATRLCNEIVLTYTGDMPTFNWSVLHNFRGLLDGELDYTRYSVGWSRRAFPPVPLAAGTEREVTFYWQGQRHHGDDRWDVAPDLDAVGVEDDHFVFNYSYDDGEGDRRIGGYGGYTSFPGNRARFTGGEGAGDLFVRTDLTLDDGSTSKKRGKPSPAYVTLEAHTYADESYAPANNVFGVHAYRLTRPDGSGEMLRSAGLGTDHDDGLYKQWFTSTALEQEGCHVLELVGADARAPTDAVDPDAFARHVWDRNVDHAAASPIYLHFNSKDNQLTVLADSGAS